MKKKFLCIFAVCLLLLSAIPANATDLSMETLDLEITVPDGWYVLTRDTDPDDPVFEAIGSDFSTTTSFFEEKGIYLNIVSPDFATEIAMTISENEYSQEIFSYSDLSDQEFEALVQEMKMEAFSSGDFLSGPYNFDIYQTEQLNFITYDMIQSDTLSSPSTKHYITIYNGKAYGLSLFCYDGDCSDEDQVIANEVIDSLHFTKTLKNPNASLFSNVNLYELFRDTSMILSWVGIIFIATGLILAKRKQKSEEK